MHRFHLPPESWPGEQSAGPLHLDGQEAHHAARVLRLEPGEEIELFDGQGRRAVCRIDAVKKHHLTLDLLQLTQDPPPASPTILALGFSKAIRRSWLLEKAVELGAAELWFWQAERSQGRIPEDVKDSWQGALIAAGKQCGAAWLPDVRTFPGGLEAVLHEAAAMQVIALWEEQGSPAPVLAEAVLRAPGPACFLLGPEGGFSSREVEVFRSARTLTASLGPSVLRWETAALTALALRFWAQAGADG
ncbi:RsmE family RNA methyltransferase [Megalodesulfovibrio paquesii]